jgi:FkbM family methyltransferase
MPTFRYNNDSNYSFEVTPETTRLTSATFSQTDGLWESDEITYFYKNVPTNKPVNIVDIGAQSGLYTLYSKFLPSATFYAFEPFPSSFKLLNDNIELNNIKNVHTYNLAISDNPGKLTLNTCASHNGLHTLGSTPMRFSDIVPIEVEVTTIDHMFYEKHIPVHYMKIDTEGWEYNILKGAEKTIMEYRPSIQLEWNITNMTQCGVDPDDLMNYIIRVLRYKQGKNLTSEELYIVPCD